MEESNLKKAKLLMDEDIYDEAQIVLEEEYLKKKTFKINNMLSDCFILQKNYYDAFEIMQDYIEEYTKDNVKFEKYITIGIKAGKILKIQQYLSDIVKYMTEYEEKNFNELVVEVQNEVKQQKKYQQVKKQLKYIGMLPYVEQYKFINQCYCLDKDVFYEIVKGPLLDRDVHPFVRGIIVYELQKLHESRPINVRTITGQKKEFIPDELENPIDISNNLIMLLRQTINDPVKLNFLEQDIYLKVMMIFYDDTMPKKQRDLLEILTTKQDKLGKLLEKNLNVLEK